MIFVDTKKCRTTNFFPPTLLLLLLDPGFEIRDQEWITIRIRNLDNHSGSSTVEDSLVSFFIYCLHFSHVILDEVHERDVMTDIIMVLLKNVLAKRSDIKVQCTY